MRVLDQKAKSGVGVLLFVSPAEIRREIIAPLCGLFGVDFGGLIGWQFSTETPDHRDWNSEMPGALSPGECQKEIRR